LEAALTRSADSLLRRKKKRRLIVYLDSTENPDHGKQEGVTYNGYLPRNFFHPPFCFTSDGDAMGAKMRPGNVHSADGALEFIKPIGERYRAWFKLL
jgi:type I site-specific restriction endonuclease